MRSKEGPIGGEVRVFSGLQECLPIMGSRGPFSWGKPSGTLKQPNLAQMKVKYQGLFL
jgi:hypothetical protein